MSLKQLVITIMYAAGSLSMAAAGVEEDMPPRNARSSVQYYGVGQFDVTPLLPALKEIAGFADSLYNEGSLKKVNVTGTTSADGPLELNERLAAERADAVACWFTDNNKLPASLVYTHSYIGTWQDVRNILLSPFFADSGSTYPKMAVDIISRGGTPADIQANLKAAPDGELWEWLCRYVLPAQRTTVVAVTGRDVERTSVISDTGETFTAPHAASEVYKEPPVEEEIEEEVVFPLQPLAEEPWWRGLYVKTNMPAWLMLWTNVAVEVDLAKHFSFTLPVYYSGFNYFTGHTKFRTLTFQPELRWWPKAGNNGFFAGAHFGLGWYNCAFGGDKRYQDHNRRTPAVGGGLAVGYRFHFCKNRRWQMEASLGAGIYRLDYDVFQNRYEGLIIDRRKRTFYGIDQAALTVSYRFDLGRKGGER